MDHTTPRLDFALIGHQESWDKVTLLINTMRQMEGSDLLPPDTIKEIFPFIPPRKVFDIKVNRLNGEPVYGIYIETFISPDNLGIKHLQQNLSKVKEACLCAANEGAKIVSLGGFTSIVLEASNSPLQEIKNTFFTTGNTLTAAFICEGIKKACIENKIDIHKSSLLIIGSTGDIGSACVNYFSGIANKLLLCARNVKQLQQQAISLQENNIHCKASVDLNLLLPEADIILFVASSPVVEWKTSLIKDDVIICDAGYPKNMIQQLPPHLKKRIFCGGMGHVAAGFHFTPRYMESFYKYPCDNASHGCLLECIVLSMEKNYLAYSIGRGNITKENMNAILQMSKKNGIEVAPFFNAEELWHQQKSIATINYE